MVVIRDADGHEVTLTRDVRDRRDSAQPRARIMPEGLLDQPDRPNQVRDLLRLSPEARNRSSTDLVEETSDSVLLGYRILIRLGLGALPAAYIVLS